MAKRKPTDTEIAAAENDAHVAFLRFHPKLDTGLEMRISPVVERLNAGAKLTKADQATLHRWYVECEEQLRWVFYRSIPRRHWQAMAGLQESTLTTHGVRAGLPLNDPLIDLTVVVKALHDQLRRGRGKPSASEPTPKILGGDGASAGGLSSEIKREALLAARRKRLQAESQLIPRDKMHAALTGLSEILREASEKLRDQFGRDAYDIIDEALDEFDSRIESFFRVGRNGKKKRKREKQ